MYNMNDDEVVKHGLRGKAVYNRSALWKSPRTNKCSKKGSGGSAFIGTRLYSSTRLLLLFRISTRHTSFLVHTLKLINAFKTISPLIIKLYSREKRPYFTSVRIKIGVGIAFFLIFKTGPCIIFLL